MKFSAIGKPEGCKLIRLDAEVDRGILVAIAIRGDFFAIPEEGFERVEARLPGTRIAELALRFTQLLKEEGVEPYGISGEGLAEVLNTGLMGASNGA